MEIGSPLSVFTTYPVENAIRFEGSIYIASATGTDSIAKLVPDPLTKRPKFIKIPGTTQAFRMWSFKDPFGGPSQLLVATSEGVMRLAGDRLLPAMPATAGPTEQTYTILQSAKVPARVFIGHGDGVRQATFTGITKKDGAPADGLLPSMIDGSIYGRPGGISKGLYRWDRAAQKFVVDNRFLLPIDAPDAGSSVNQDDDGSVFSSTSASDQVRVGRFFKQPDGSWKLDEDTYRPLTHYRLGTAFVDGDFVWAYGEVLVRLDTRIKPRTVALTAPVIREVLSGPKILYGGAQSPARLTFASHPQPGP